MDGDDLLWLKCLLILRTDYYNINIINNLWNIDEDKEIIICVELLDIQEADRQRRFC